MTEPASAESPKRKRGCLWGCGGCLGLIAATACILVAGVFVLRVLRPNPEKLFAGASDPVAEAAVEQALLNAGVQGAQVTVIPIQGSSDQLAYIVFDDQRGFDLGAVAQGGEMGLANALLQLDQANRDQNLNIGPVAMEYRDANGDPLIVVATEESQISAFAAGQISREELLAGTEVDLSSILGGVQALSGAAGQ